MQTKELKTEKRTFVIRKPKDQYYDIALAIIGGIKTLTQLEKDILKAMIIVHNEATKSNTTVSDLLTKKVRHNLQTNLKISPSNLNNYIARLKKKGIIKETELGFTVIPQLIIPEADILEISFKIVAS